MHNHMTGASQYTQCAWKILKGPFDIPRGTRKNPPRDSYIPNVHEGTTQYLECSTDGVLTTAAFIVFGTHL